ncbi:MAG: hypothetical protein AMXMBFR52_08850 [Burkholderiales bacterium]|nr:helicase-related protein [Burkholderiaceae bacterium]
MPLTKESTSEAVSLAALQAENERLIALLEASGIEWQRAAEPATPPSKPESSRLSAEAKVALFRRRFRGRTDVYPVRWESKTTGKPGYAPACANEWRAGVCEKPRIKCADCRNRSLIPLSDAAIYAHLVGDRTMGVYPLLEDDSCWFLAIDFDEAEWSEDVRAFAGSCAENYPRHVALLRGCLDAAQDLEVLPRSCLARIDLPSAAGIQEVFRHLANDRSRTAAIAAEVRKAFDHGRKVLVLTERTEHLDSIRVALGAGAARLFVLHGRMSRKKRATVIAELDALPPDAPRILLATGKLVGEGFDHPPLDTLVLAMPVSWKGILQQYAGRLHREHAGKTDVRIIDFVDTGHPALLRMWHKRQRGYRAMGYSTCAGASAAGPVEAELQLDQVLPTGVQR